jgi:spermidine/putrescine transport system substrate-binding protein
MASGRSTITRFWRFAVTMATLVVALSLAACGGDDGIEEEDQSTEAGVAKAEGEPSGELVIANWPLYIDKQTIPEFEGETGISVKYVEEINSYDEFFAKMQPSLERGESGDRSLIVATDWLAKRMYDLGYLQRLDQEALAPALENLNPEIKPASTDPDHEFSIPWQGGLTGLVVNTEDAPDFTSLNDVFDPRYKGRVVLISELREVVPLFMKADGIDPEEATEEDWLATIEKLRQGVRSGQIRSIGGNEYVRDMASGDAVAAVAWAADAIQLQADDPAIDFVMPEEGCITWYDNWVIPVGAPNPTAAYEFINYTYEPENQAQIVSYVSSVTPLAGVREILEQEDPEVADSELIFPTEDYTAECSSAISPPGGPEAEHRVEQAWSDVLIGG